MATSNMFHAQVFLDVLASRRRAEVEKRPHGRVITGHAHLIHSHLMKVHDWLSDARKMLYTPQTAPHRHRPTAIVDLLLMIRDASSSQRQALQKTYFRDTLLVGIGRVSLSAPPCECEEILRPLLRHCSSCSAKLSPPWLWSCTMGMPIENLSGEILARQRVIEARMTGRIYRAEWMPKPILPQYARAHGLPFFTPKRAGVWSVSAFHAKEYRFFPDSPSRTRYWY